MANLDFKTIGQGRFQKTGPRSGKFFGPKHVSKGIKTVGPDGNMIEVEGGESVGEVNTNMGRQPYIYSDYVKRHGGVSYADEFDKMVNSGAPQRELDMLAAEQDSRAKRTGGEIQVTPMQYGGVYNNLNNNTMNRYRRGGNPQYKGDYFQYGGMPSEDRNITGYGPQGNPNQARKSPGDNIVVIWPNKPRGPQGGGGTDVPVEREYQMGGSPSQWENYRGAFSDPRRMQQALLNRIIQENQMRTSDIPDPIAPTENYTPSEIGGRPEWTYNPGVKRRARADTVYDRFQEGGLGNRVMQYQGDQGTGMVQPTPNTRQGGIEQPRSGDRIGGMMNMLQFSNQQGIESLSTEAQNQVRAEFAAMTPEEQQQWINFMNQTSGDTQSPTRRDPEAELIERIMNQY